MVRESVKSIIWLHNLIISHLETDYCHSSGTPSFSFLYTQLSTHSDICYDSTPELHPRGPMEVEQIFNFFVVTILVSRFAGF